MVYKLIVDSIRREEWEELASHFGDYSIYQTWPYQQVRAEMDGQEVSRMIIKDDNENVVSMCQIRIKHVKPLGLKIGYARWGPFIRRKDGTLTVSSEVLNSFRRAYLGPRINVLRILPNVCNDESGRAVARLIESSGFYRVKNVRPHHTMFLPLDYSEAALRKRLHQSWRRQLRKAEKSGLEIVECDSDESFGILGKLYLETLQRKGFKGLDPQEFIRTQRMLLPAERMRLIMAYCDGVPVSAHLTSNLGDSAVFLLGGSSEEGLARRASYLSWWRAITFSNQMGMKRYDVGGVDFEKNPTVSRFKAGIGGNDVLYIGAFEACTRPSIKALWRAAEGIYNLMKGR